MIEYYNPKMTKYSFSKPPSTLSGKKFCPPHQFRRFLIFVCAPKLCTFWIIENIYSIKNDKIADLAFYGKVKEKNIFNEKLLPFTLIKVDQNWPTQNLRVSCIIQQRSASSECAEIKLRERGKEGLEINLSFSL